MSAGDWLELYCHPSCRTDAMRAMRARVNRAAGNQLRINFCLEADLRSIVVPSPTTSRIGHELWRHTCFEAFIAIEGRQAYYEFNFAPSGEWTIYAMRAYRDGAPLADESMRPEILVRSSAILLELEAVVQLDRLSEEHARAPLSIGLTAVVEAADGYSYWALVHPENKPDFHNPLGFALRLEPPASQS